HNAKFDLAMLENAGVKVADTIHDSMAIARLVNSELFLNDFSLDKCAQKLGYRKDDKVAAYIIQHKLYKQLAGPDGKGKGKKDLLYTLVPLELMVPYGEKDAEITYKLGVFQREALVSYARS